MAMNNFWLCYSYSCIFVNIFFFILKNQIITLWGFVNLLSSLLIVWLCFQASFSMVQATTIQTSRNTGRKGNPWVNLYWRRLWFYRFWRDRNIICAALSCTFFFYPPRCVSMSERDNDALQLIIVSQITLVCASSTRNIMQQF